MFLLSLSLSDLLLVMVSGELIQYHYYILHNDHNHSEISTNLRNLPQVALPTQLLQYFSVQVMKGCRTPIAGAAILNAGAEREVH